MDGPRSYWQDVSPRSGAIKMGDGWIHCQPPATPSTIDLDIFSSKEQMLGQRREQRRLGRVIGGSAVKDKPVIDTSFHRIWLKGIQDGRLATVRQIVTTPRSSSGIQMIVSDLELR